jgi:hypothetical protein
MKANLKYQPKANEMEAFKSHFQKREKQPWPRMKVDGAAGKTVLSYDHPDSCTGQVLLMEAIGTADYDFYAGLIQQLGNSSSRGGKVDEGLLNFMLSVVKGIKPRDQIEIMLAAQMAAIHEAIMTFTKAAGSCGHDSSAGQCRARTQQAGPDLCNPNGGAAALPRRAKGCGSTSFRKRRRARQSWET